MAGQKRIIPSHVKAKHCVHPGIERPIIQFLEQVEDPRRPSLFVRDSLTSILFMVVVAVLCGATVVVMCNGMSDWRAHYVDMSSGVPCE